MKHIRVLPIVLIVISVLSGCKTTEVVQQDQPVKIAITKPTSELRGFVVLPESWINNDVEIMKKNIISIIESTAEANYNSIFFYVRDQVEKYNPSHFKPGFDPLDVAIETAHKHHMEIYAGIDLLKQVKDSIMPDHYEADISFNPDWIIINQEKEPLKVNGSYLLNPSLPQVKTYLKKIIGGLIISYNIDGISFDLTDYSSQIQSFDDFSNEKYYQDSLLFPQSREDWTIERLTDLIEDVAVEAMLVKPYLVNSVVFSRDLNPYAANWIKQGIVDFVIPPIDTETENPVQDLKTYWDDIHKQKEQAINVFPMFSLNNTSGKNEKIKDLIKFIRESGGHGMVLITTQPESDRTIPYPLPYRYPGKINLPDSLKQITPEQVVGFDVSALFPENHSGQSLFYNNGNKNKITDSEGKIGFITSNPDTIKLSTSNGSVTLPTERWAIPFNYAILPGNITMRKSPWVEFRRMPEKYTDIPEYHLLCKTEYPASAWIDNEAVKIYKTGVFFNKIILNKGLNRVRASVLTQDSLLVFYEREFRYEEIERTRPPFPLWIDEKTVEPAVDIELLAEDVVLISFQGSLGQQAFVELNPGGIRLECSREDQSDFSLYQAELPLRKLTPGYSYTINLNLEASVDTLENPLFGYTVQNSIRIREADDYPLVKIINENSRLTYNVGPVRLGGPIRSELGPGIIMKTNGKIGENFRIHLSRVENGIIHQNAVEELPAETVQPTYFITNMSCGPSKGGDVLRIPYLEPVPYEVYPDPAQNRIVITLFGAKTSSTWITHGKGRKIIDEVTWQQTTPETYVIYVNLKTPKIWGYDIRRVGSNLLLRIKYPPKYNLNNKKPLAGLKFAIEAGHGGKSTGAIGLSGLLEKDINLDLSLLLGEVCESMGAEVLQVRESDKDMSLIEKRDIAQLSNADLLVSIHANAASVNNGYLLVPGTSTYYNNPFWAPMAGKIYNRLLELGLAEFGIIGSFNYTGIRVSQMPAILVEQAFLTHAEDEEKLADPQFRQRMAQKIYEGIIDYLLYMEEN